jgi:hypothetical protein
MVVTTAFAILRKQTRSLDYRGLRRATGLSLSLARSGHQVHVIGLNGVLQRLVLIGLTRRVADARDGRVKRVQLTRKARRRL